MRDIEATELVHDCGRAWAMRTGRDAPDDQALIWEELKAGRLRQGWGYAQEQDLAQVLEREKRIGRENLTEAERGAWRHARFAGSLCGWEEDEMREGDFVLVPNMPTNGVFSICRITGPYRFEIMPDRGDFGHIRPVELLTGPQGVSNAHPLVSSALARSLRSRSRLWWIGNHHLSLAEILSAAKAGKPLQTGSTPLERATSIAWEHLRPELHAISDELGKKLGRTLQGADWESVIQRALTARPWSVEVAHTGGPTERGADLEIRIPNPFTPEFPWLILVQVKDYDGEVSSNVLAQLEDAVQSRAPRPGAPHQVLAVILAVTRAEPSPEMKNELLAMRERLHVPVEVVHGSDLMLALTRGLLAEQELWQNGREPD